MDAKIYELEQQNLELKQKILELEHRMEKIKTPKYKESDRMVIGNSDYPDDLFEKYTDLKYYAGVFIINKPCTSYIGENTSSPVGVAIGLLDEFICFIPIDMMWMVNHSNWRYDLIIPILNHIDTVILYYEYLSKKYEDHVKPLSWLLLYRELLKHKSVLKDLRDLSDLEIKTKVQVLIPESILRDTFINRELVKCIILFT